MRGKEGKEEEGRKERGQDGTGGREGAKTLK